MAKVAELLDRGINVVAVDLLPPNPRAPLGLHAALWEEIGDGEPFEPPPDRRLTAAAYAAGPPLTGYVEPIAVGDPLPSVPLFLGGDRYVPCPLEATYQVTWGGMPAPIRRLLEPGPDSAG